MLLISTKNLTFNNSTIHIAGASGSNANLTFNSLTGIFGTGTITLDGSANGNVVNGLAVIPNNLTIQTGTSGGLILSTTLSGVLSAQTSNATITAFGTNFSVTTTVSLQASNGGKVSFVGSLTDAGAINIGSGSSITIASTFSQNASTVINGSGTLSATNISGFLNTAGTVAVTGFTFNNFPSLNTLASLTLAGSTDNWTGTLNVGSADLIVRSTTGDTSILLNQLHQGFNNGTWSGTGGITSSSAVATSASTFPTGIALMTGAQLHRRHRQDHL